VNLRGFLAQEESNMLTVLCSKQDIAAAQQCCPSAVEAEGCDVLLSLNAPFETETDFLENARRHMDALLETHDRSATTWLSLLERIGRYVMAGEDTRVLVAVLPTTVSDMALYARWVATWIAPLQQAFEQTPWGERLRVVVWDDREHPALAEVFQTTHPDGVWSTTLDLSRDARRRTLEERESDETHALHDRMHATYELAALDLADHHIQSAHERYATLAQWNLERHDHAALTWNYWGLASCLVSLERPEDAKARAEEGLALATEVKDLSAVQLFLDLLASMATKAGDPAEALRHYLQLGRVATVRGDVPSACRSEMLAGESAWTLGAHPQAVERWRTSEILGTSQRLKHHLRALAQTEVRAYERVGLHERMEEAQAKIRALDDKPS
jgi:tetratricopeptide (TPR) repeat protein